MSFWYSRACSTQFDYYSVATQFQNENTGEQITHGIEIKAVAVENDTVRLSVRTLMKMLIV
ncbi:hypothetical protein [Metapseudomonas furukawaii]